MTDVKHRPLPAEVVESVVRYAGPIPARLMFGFFFFLYPFISSLSTVLSPLLSPLYGNKSVGLTVPDRNWWKTCYDIAQKRSVS